MRGILAVVVAEMPQTGLQRPRSSGYIRGAEKAIADRACHVARSDAPVPSPSQLASSTVVAQVEVSRCRVETVRTMGATLREREYSTRKEEFRRPSLQCPEPLRYSVCALGTHDHDVTRSSGCSRESPYRCAGPHDRGDLGFVSPSDVLFSRY